MTGFCLPFAHIFLRERQRLLDLLIGVFVPIRSVYVRIEAHRCHLVPSPLVEDGNPGQNDSGESPMPDSPLIHGHPHDFLVRVQDHAFHHLFPEEFGEKHQIRGVGKQIDFVVLCRRQ